ncbi:MAG: hypothetical protein JSR46_05125 [Verrucomicrobia bacterium]|nr:hypothetical protein [Verrucomicrobiota bacterium]
MFEGLGEGLEYATLEAKLLIAGDRNLGKLFLRYINECVGPFHFFISIKIFSHVFTSSSRFFLIHP